MSITALVDHRPGLLSVRDQGPRPTCLSHAATVAHEWQRQITTALSPEYLHYFASGGSRHSGATVSSVSDSLSVEGQPTETDCPYFSTYVPKGWAPPPNLFVYKYVSRIEPKGFSDVEIAIRSGLAPVLCMSLPEPFYSPQPPWIIDPAGPIRALHAVTGIGIGRYGSDSLVLIRNSWGASWGDAGHAWLNTTYLSIHLKAVLCLKGAAVP
jgi:papain like protease